MAHVLAIQVCLRVASVSALHNVKSNTNVTDCQGEALPSDGRMRRIFQRVIALRNRDGVMP